MNQSTALDIVEQGISIAGDVSSVGRLGRAVGREKKVNSPKQCLRRGRESLVSVVTCLEEHRTKMPSPIVSDLRGEHDTYDTFV